MNIQENVCPYHFLKLFPIFFPELVYKEILDFQSKKEEESMQTGWRTSISWTFEKLLCKLSLTWILVTFYQEPFQ